MGIGDVRLYRDRGLLQPPRRRRGRSDDFAFQQEHVDRLHFIRCALDYGFTVEDIAELIDPAALVTCGDVRTLTQRRLEELHRSGGADAPKTAALAQLREKCAGVGSRKDCGILVALTDPGC
jgi:MerR family mercuric resistance operon transcriptional regulator